MIPVLVPSPAGSCLAMYGPAPGPAVLICPPFGDEALRTARTWRDLALRLGDKGFATLRFDLPGTGNAEGDPTEPNRIAAWRAAVRACADWLSLRHAGRVVLFGHRFGALLALDAVAVGVAAERLVLLDPPTSGAALARYLRARARLARGDAVPAPDGIYVGGTPVSAATLTDLAILPASLDGVVPPPALLVLDERPGAASPWPDRLRDRGGVVETAPFENLDAFVNADTFNTASPRAVLDRVVGFLAPTAAPVAVSSVTPWPIAAELALDGCSETSIQFGPGRALFGILCRPHEPAPGTPALLLPTMGADPCSGMARMWTELARRVARSGVTSLRFDMRGVGESGGDLGDDRLLALYRPDRVADLAAAVDTMQTLGFEQVKIVGYCAGAYAAWHAALPDPRIAAILAGNIVYLNLQPTLPRSALIARPGSSRIGMRDDGITRFLPTSGLNALRRLDDGSRRIVPRRLRMALRGLGAEPKQTRRHVKALVARGCLVSLVMAHDDHGHVRLRQAFGETPRLPAGVDLTVIADADHQFSDPRHRARFLDLAASFALRRHTRLPAIDGPREPARLLETA